MTSECPHFGPCGGCTQLDAHYQVQLAAKEAHVIDLLHRHELLRHAEVRPILGDARPFFYRNKAIYPLQQHGSRVLAGFYRRGSHAIVDVHECLIQDPALTAMANRLRELIITQRLAVYDERRHLGFMRALHLRVGSTGELMIGLVTNAGPLADAQQLVTRIEQASRGLVTRSKQPVSLVALVRNVNQARTNVILGNHTDVLAGRSYLRDKIGKLTLRVSLPSFYQVNPDQAAVAYRLAVELAGDARAGRVVDAYAGIGTIALWFAPHAREVIGLEQAAAAVVDARVNAADNGFDHCVFHAGRVEQTLDSVAGAIDLLILDPPRSGCSRAALDAVLTQQARRILYLSCAPRTFARDAAWLVARGYRLESLQPIDFFPHTEHVELLAAFAR